MTSFKTLTGTWKREKQVYTGVVDASETARCIAGSETDSEYEIFGKVTIISGKAAAIVFFTYSEDWEEQYLEMVLDPINEKVTLEGVIRNPDGSEKTRTTLASRDMTLKTGHEYHFRMVAKTADDGTGYVLGFIDDFEVVRVEDLASPFVAGMYGLECLGSADQYSEFSKLHKYKMI